MDEDDTKEMQHLKGIIKNVVIVALLFVCYVQYDIIKECHMQKERLDKYHKDYAVSTQRYYEELLRRKEADQCYAKKQG